MVGRVICWWRGLGRAQQFALLVAALVTAVRFSLTGKGAMAFIDERRYITAMLGLRALSEGHVSEFFQAINSMGARPGDGLWRIIPGLVQGALLLLFQLNPNSPPSLQVPQLFNVVVMSLNALLLYRIYRRFCSVGFALLGVALYSSLANTNLYIRHLLPYDHALFFFLVALWLLLRRPAGSAARQHWVVGALSGISCAVYPGYFMGPAVLLLLGLFPSDSQDAARPGRPVARLKPLAVQLLGLLAVLITFELLAQFSDTSYFASSRYIATTVTQGDFAEGFSFIGAYFWQAEGWMGLALLALSGAGLWLSIRGATHGLHAGAPMLAGLLAVSFMAWASYGALVVFAQKLVFYGRILHFFVPFIVLGAVVALQSVADYWRTGGKLLMASSALASLWHFGAFVAAYRAIDYPADIAYRHGIYDSRQIASSITTGCDQHLIFYLLFGAPNRNQRTTGFPKYHLVNFAYLYPLSCYQAPAPNARPVVASVPYFMKFTPYQFEGHSPAQRALLQQNPYVFRISKTH